MLGTLSAMRQRCILQRRLWPENSGGAVEGSKSWAS
jgi:hypothetical protein